jgi:pyruvate,water dikinase
MTNPAWQVLYGKIIAVVTNAGDLVAHPAVLAREYGIPAVVGTSTGTHRIATGDRIRVDGDTGVVVVLAAASSPGGVAS